jgi:protein-disulfide isomerase
MLKKLAWTAGALVFLASALATAQPVEDVPKPTGHFTDLMITADDHAIGQPNAPITVIEYASLTCPHCAHFANDVLPAIKKEFIVTGKVRLIYRDFPLDRLALDASMIARCSGPLRYFSVIESLFAAQESWAGAKDPIAALTTIAESHGMSAKDVQACLADKSVGDAVLKQRLDGDKAFHIKGTPTIIIGGDEYGGALSIESFRAIVAQKLAQR